MLCSDPLGLKKSFSGLAAVAGNRSSWWWWWLEGLLWRAVLTLGTSEVEAMLVAVAKASRYCQACSQSSSSELVASSPLLCRISIQATMTWDF